VILIDRVSKSLLKLFWLALCCWLTAIVPARAEFCRQVDGHQICILKIERSAKNYWQYQAMASIDGVEKPIASYDCRDRLITDFDGNLSSFRSRQDGKLICSLYRR
jgi:hypothetical protein